MDSRLNPWEDNISKRISVKEAKRIARGDVARLIDYTNLNPEVTGLEIEKLCRQAIKYHFYSVCIHPYFIPLAKSFLNSSDVKICTVIGFPLGANFAKVKAYEAEAAAKEGAQEFDMVINISALKDQDYHKVREDIKGVVNSVAPLTCKVILETALLTKTEKEIVCQIAGEAGAHFVKTSTGFEKSGATIEDVMLMRNVVGDDMGVKAAGGIKNYQTTLKMVDAGATRIGVSKGVRIVQESNSFS